MDFFFKIVDGTIVGANTPFWVIVLLALWSATCLLAVKIFSWLAPGEAVTYVTLAYLVVGMGAFLLWALSITFGGGAVVFGLLVITFLLCTPLIAGHLGK